MGLRQVGWSAALVALWTAGCNKSETPGAAGPAGTPSVAQASGAAPDVYFKTFLTETSAGNAGAVWNALPAKHQADVKSIIQEAAGKLDADVWNKGFGAIGKLAQVLKTKKDYILGSALFAEAPPPVKEALGKNWESIVAMVDTLANSEIKTLDGLKNVDPGKFLNTTGSKLLLGGLNAGAASNPDAAKQIQAIKDSKVTVVSQTGDDATIKVESEGEAPREYKLKKVDGKWLPAEMAAGWDKQIADIKTDLATMSMTPEQKTLALGALSTMDTTLDKLSAAADQKAFDTEMMTVVGMMAMIPGIGGPMPGPGGPMPGPGGPLGPSSLKPGLPGAGPTLPGTSGSPANPALPGATPALPGAPALPNNPTLPATPK